MPDQTPADPILKLLLQSRQRPGMYFGSNELKDVHQFLAGYRMALYELMLQDSRLAAHADTSQSEAFFEGLYVKYGRGGGGHSWAFVLTNAAGGDRDAAWTLLQRELSEFLDRAPSRKEKP
jgi:hypothetical protein